MKLTIIYKDEISHGFGEREFITHYAEGTLSRWVRDGRASSYVVNGDYIEPLHLSESAHDTYGLRREALQLLKDEYAASITATGHNNASGAVFSEANRSTGKPERPAQWGEIVGEWVSVRHGLPRDGADLLDLSTWTRGEVCTALFQICERTGREFLVSFDAGETWNCL